MDNQGMQGMQNPDAVDPEQRKKAQAFAEMIKAMAKQQRREGLIENNQVAVEDEDDLNILPMPIDQKVLPEYMLWTWQPTSRVLVSAYLFRKNVDYANFKHKRGEWYVVMEKDEESATIGFSTDFDEAKLVGQALISAWNYERVWKLHAGTFMERQLFTDEDGETKVAGKAAGKVGEITVIESDDIPPGEKYVGDVDTTEGRIDL